MRPPEQTPALSDARGYAMAVLLVALAVMLTLMTMAMPVWKQQAKREKEEELLFRLKQYAHALALYQRRLPGASPANLDDLVKERYLRKKYKDPMTGKDFAILRVGQVSPGMTATLPVGGRPGAPAPQGSGTSMGRPAGGSPSPTAPGTTFGGTSSAPGQVLQPGMGGASGAVGGIRGVVSTSKETSLRAWKGRTQYDQWEVAIEDITPRFFGVQSPQPGQNQRPGGPGPGRPGGQTGPSSPSPGSLPNNPYGNTIRRQ
ncbi:type II secretion system protein [Luteitalea sp. TBR-22]|uniref:type II secretion system protein n=1 Tax=Luteitalea sp. TBR-22 TaxID=2802971 RepID=UPI001EF4F322|nr:type II secretion system protein [Luteitalea sp. TBR-22]